MRRGVALLAVTLSVSGMPPGGAPRSAAGPARPNILVIVTDDQRQMDTLAHMPKTRQWFGQGGVTYPNAFAVTPLCCPSRAAIMTGRFSHNNGVRTNFDAADLNQGSTIQSSLRRGGYRTALVGKYLNGWPVGKAPPGFDDWLVLNPSSQTYENNEYNDRGTVGSIPGYSTDVLTDRAVSLIESNAGGPDPQPWFMLVTPYAPHHPWEPAERHADADVGTWDGSPAVTEQDRSDKPPYVRGSDVKLAFGRIIREGQLRTNMAVDEMVDALFQALQAEGEQNTLAIFVSDNGFMWAEHGLYGKDNPYAASVRVPMMARWPGRLPAGAVDGRLVANIDIAPTAIQASGIDPAPAFAPDGRSLLLGRGRSKMLLEGWPSGHPWASVITPQYQYIETFGPGGGRVRFREYYDLPADPWQLSNLYGDGTRRNDPYAGALRKELRALQRCEGQGGRRGCARLLDRRAVPTRCGRGRDGHRHLVGSPRRDRIRGVAGRDVLCGRRGKDRLRGGPGRDLLIGGGGRDLCVGGGGRDRYRRCEVRRR